MQLAEQGLVNLDDEIGSILDFDVQNPYYTDRAITVRQILSHTSGIIDGDTYSDFLSATYSDDPIPDIRELINSNGSYYSTGLFNNNEPGSYFNYSNLNFGILGTIIEKVSGQRFDDYCKEHIFDALDLDASFNVNHIDNINNVAVLYRKYGSNWSPQADNYQGVQPEFTNLDGYIPGTNGLRFAPQGGLRISALDLSKLFSVFLDEGSYSGTQILEVESIEDMMAPEWEYNGSNGNNYYGLFRSWGLGMHLITNTANNDIVLPESNKMFGHPGEAYGLVSDAYIDSLRKVGIIFMTNGSGTDYTIGGGSAFYTVEKDIFDAIEASGAANLCGCLAVEENPEEQINLFPNPVNDILQIRVNQDLIGKSFSIYDLSGKMMLCEKLINSIQGLDISPLHNGIYFLQIEGSSQRYKLIKL
jgi:CubicO group peptidase (beta-lactamase class C family)